MIERDGSALRQQGRERDKQGRDVGVMHACGHDMHMTCFIGTARWLAEHKDRWSGTVVMIGQPAEEGVGGARRCSRTAFTRGFRSPISPSPCTARRPSRLAPTGEIIFFHHGITKAMEDAKSQIINMNKTAKDQGFLKELPL